MKAAYADNAGYDEDDSPTMAKRFITACRLLLLYLPRSASKDSEQFELNPALIGEELKAAKRWLQQADDSDGASGGYKSLDFGSFRT